MYRLCYLETFNVCFFRSAGRLSNRSGAAAISFDGCLVFHFRYSVVDSSMRVRYSIAYRTLVRQVILTYCCRKSGCRFRQPTLQKLSLINMGFSDSSKNPQYLLQFPSKRLSAVRHPSTAACPKRIWYSQPHWRRMQLSFWNLHCSNCNHRPLLLRCRSSGRSTA